MKKLLFLTLSAMMFSIASFASPLPPIGGPTSLCLGDTVSVYDTSSTGGGGTWSSSNTGVCIIGLTSGVIYGVSPGTSTITWYSGGSSTSMTFTVNAAPPPPIIGTTTFCAGTSSQLSDATPGGTWSSGSAYVATVNPATGLVTGLTGGTAYISYSTGGACDAGVYVTVNTTDPGFIVGPTSVCAAGGSINLMDSTIWGGSGSAWSSSNTTIATIDASGNVYGIAVGTVTISYEVIGICGTAYATQVINVINTTDPGVIYGSSSVNIGATNSLNETVSGGTWSSSNTAIATIDASGVVTGVAAGTATITYTVSGCGGSADTTFAVTVTPINGISGYVNFPGAAYYGNVTVWLITYNPSTMDLQAIDSTIVYCLGSSIYYQFLGIATDSYRVKAAVYDSAGVATTGYIPTYHTSSYYWYSANVINHTSGTADVNEDINMAYGTITGGPGFIGGNVTAGANRSTSTTGIPVVGLNMIVINSTTNHVVQSTITNASGNYSFSNLPLGTYYIFPDSLNYMTTAYTSITLTSSSATMNVANFTQHTLSKTITPNNEGVSNVSNSVSSVITFPNPTNGKLNLQWTENATEKGNVSITDITGREVYKTAINMNQGTGVKQIDLSDLINGLYMMSLKSGDINYNTKIQIQK